MGIGTCYPRSLHLILFYAFVFFSVFSYPPARIREVPVQCSTTLFFFYFIFAHCRQTSHSLPCSHFFPDPSLHYPSIFSRSLSCWPLADPESHSPHPLLLSSSRALFTFFCLLIYDPAMLLSSLPRSLLFYRSRALPYIGYPSLSLCLRLLPKQACSFYKLLCPLPFPVFSLFY